MNYKETISKIRADDELKETIVKKLEEKNYNKKGGIMMKVKKVIIGILSALAILVGSGVAYAAIRRNNKWSSSIRMDGNKIFRRKL